MTATSTRRAVLAGAAALPALSLPSVAAETDPIFAAIELHSRLENELDRLNVTIGEIEDEATERRPDTQDEIDAWRKRLGTFDMESRLEPCDLENQDAVEALKHVVPTTKAGALALLDHLREQAELNRAPEEAWTAALLANALQVLRA